MLRQGPVAQATKVSFDRPSDTANATIYTAPGGATLFAAGTIQWSYGLDNFGGTTFVNPGVQKVTSNVLARFTGSPAS
jgi:hypothetical protein